eukprot:SAG31_NODE_15145_length_768_cov_0.847534_1_plen_183_part_01
MQQVLQVDPAHEMALEELESLRAQLYYSVDDHSGRHRVAPAAVEIPTGQDSDQAESSPRFETPCEDESSRLGDADVPEANENDRPVQVHAVALLENLSRAEVDTSPRTSANEEDCCNEPPLNDGNNSRNSGHGGSSGSAGTTVMVTKAIESSLAEETNQSTKHLGTATDLLDVETRRRVQMTG